MAAASMSEDLSSSEASAAEIISKMSEYQFIAVVQDGNGCEPMEQVVNERGEVVAINTNEYYETIGGQAVELNFEGIEMKEESENERTIESNCEIEKSQSLKNISHGDTDINTTTEILNSDNAAPSGPVASSETTIVEGFEQHETCPNISVRDILLPLGIKLNENGTHIPTKRKRMKSSLFVGCTSEASQVLQEFERLKDELQIRTNVQLLKILIENARKELSKVSSSIDCVVQSTNENDSKAILQLVASNKEADDNEIDTSSSVNEDSAINIVNNCPTQINTPQDVGQVLGLTALNIKTIQLTKKYLEHIGKEGFYISGFVDGSEKLDEFLKSFRIMTGSAFSIRRSKAKINDDPEPEEKPLRKYKPGYLGKGQIKWEKNIGIPPIPFTGVPFTTEGSTTYQCIYGPKRAKAAGSMDHKENDDEDELQRSLQEPAPKRRKSSRESKKKDCPAQIHIRTVHRFPTYNCLSPIQPVKTTSATTYVNKCQRGIILAKLREDIVNDKVQGQQGFWVRVPLPDVHQNHSLGPFDGTESALTEETILEMKSILHNAAITS